MLGRKEETMKMIEQKEVKIMKKVPTDIDEVWKECLRMWRWISDKIRKMKKEDLDISSVFDLKREWLTKNDYDLSSILNECFFCTVSPTCRLCPGRKVDPTFDCVGQEYDFFTKPIKFYNKLRSLNRKRTNARKYWTIHGTIAGRKFAWNCAQKREIDLGYRNTFSEAVDEFEKRTKVKWYE
jgi:hypothetical protein